MLSGKDSNVSGLEFDIAVLSPPLLILYIAAVFTFS